MGKLWSLGSNPGSSLKWLWDLREITSLSPASLTCNVRGEIESHIRFFSALTFCNHSANTKLTDLQDLYLSISSSSSCRAIRTFC